jgi:VIT1/CCC1 family predicted Fe2+/Mn2+ transporter
MFLSRLSIRSTCLYVDFPEYERSRGLKTLKRLMDAIPIERINGFMVGRKDLERAFLRGEMLDQAVYSALAAEEKDRELKALLTRLASEEKGHIGVWRSLLGEEGKNVRAPALIGLRVHAYRLMKRVLGNAFVVRLLERGETEGLARYRASLEGGGFGEKEKHYARTIIAEEEGHEAALGKSVDKYESKLDYMESTILGLNDGLVEILAVIAGLATVATSSLIVVIIGMIAGISGTLSMAGGVYLSAKSENLVKGGGREMGEADGVVSPRKAAYNTGAYYFIGALIAVLPFLLGLNGVAGIVASIVLVSVALVGASTIVAITSGTSVRRRASEMLAISLGAAFVTILFGTFARVYFGVSI